ncbi:MAG: aminotransferase class I/II-fold pyridoxal phosphate-dependent enzyme [Helicobacteraceae bacterium]|nr:aminotransferase class I/II-fold pyridoxal phosphate-dependent enzyme [Helicobacteraceae bacterium]
MYSSEIKALKKSERFRERIIYEDTVIDLASNDYLGLSHNKDILEETTKELLELDSHAPKASMLVNGYHKIHQNFERALCEINDFEDGVVLGSGFSANIAMIESLLRRGDELFIDEKYHASGILATKLIDAKITFFSHNSAGELEQLLKISQAKRKVVAVEGIYSMDADLLNPKIVEIANAFNALLIVDEAHSSGVVGKNLMGVFDLYNIKIKPNHIKMGTLGKAYGSFGGYILASKHIIEYLVNRAKPIIYATAPSLFDTLLAHKSLEFILKNRDELKEEITKRQNIVKDIFDLKIDGLILPIVIENNSKVMSIKEKLLEKNILIGAIRQPTVTKPIVRLIARLGIEESLFINSLRSVKCLM